jgi:hypothetical protein
MLALLLYLWLGREAALLEIAAEISIGLAITGGGGGRRVRRLLLLLLELLRRHAAPVPA